jgi:hypothetical protein
MIRDMIPDPDLDFCPSRIRIQKTVFFLYRKVWEVGGGVYPPLLTTNIFLSWFGYTFHDDVTVILGYFLHGPKKGEIWNNLEELSKRDKR